MCVYVALAEMVVVVIDGRMCVLPIGGVSLRCGHPMPFVFECNEAGGRVNTTPFHSSSCAETENIGENILMYAPFGPSQDATIYAQPKPCPTIHPGTDSLLMILEWWFDAIRPACHPASVDKLSLGPCQAAMVSLLEQSQASWKKQNSFESFFYFYFHCFDSPRLSSGYKGTNKGTSSKHYATAAWLSGGYHSACVQSVQAT